MNINEALKQERTTRLIQALVAMDSAYEVVQSVSTNLGLNPRSLAKIVMSKSGKVKADERGLKQVREASPAQLEHRERFAAMARERSEAKKQLEEKPELIAPKPPTDLEDDDKDLLGIDFN